MGWERLGGENTLSAIDNHRTEEVQNERGKIEAAVKDQGKERSTNCHINYRVKILRCLIHIGLRCVWRLHSCFASMVLIFFQAS